MVATPKELLIPIGGGTIVAEPEDPWEVCRRRLDEVLLPSDDHSLLVNRLKNGRDYYDQGEYALATWELGQAHRRASTLKSQYA